MKEKQYEINIQLEEHTKADESYYLTVSTVFNLAKNAIELFESSEVPEKRAILNYILQNYTINEKTPCITMRSPFNEILSFQNNLLGSLERSTYERKMGRDFPLSLCFFTADAFIASARIASKMLCDAHNVHIVRNDTNYEKRHNPTIK